MKNQIISIPIGYKNNLEISHNELFIIGSSFLMIIILIKIFLLSIKLDKKK